MDIMSNRTTIEISKMVRDQLAKFKINKEIKTYDGAISFLLSFYLAIQRNSKYPNKSLEGGGMVQH